MTDIEEVMRAILLFRDKRDWKKFHTPENLAKSISIEAGELLEVFQWGDKYSTHDLKNELADVLIYCLLMADSIGVDPLQIVFEKVRTNEDRFPVDRVKGTSGRSTKLGSE